MVMEALPANVTRTPTGSTVITSALHHAYFSDGALSDGQSWADLSAASYGQVTSADVVGSANGSAAAADSSGVQAFYEQLLSHPNIRMRDDLQQYATPVIVVFGNFSNLLALIVLRRNNLRQHSVCVYMAAYAVANLLVLNLILGIAWLCFVLDTQYIGSISDWGCRLWTFLSNVIIYCGIWFVVVLSIDRFIYLCHARKAASYCTVFAAKTIVLIVLIGLVVVSIHAMWTYELQPQGCFVSFEQQDLHTLIWPWWSASIYSYLPLTLLLFINIVLSISLCLKRHRQRRSQQVGTADDFAITTLVISSCFFLLAVPATIINVIDIHFPMSWLSIDLIAQIELTKKITEILSSVNQTMLGTILLIFSRAFRQELYALASAIHLKRRPKVYEMCNMSNDSGLAAGADQEDEGPSRNHIEYHACNSADVTSSV